MSDLSQRLASLSPAQRQLLEQRLAKARPATPEPIAIIGMACRFPGAPNLDAYWQLIRECRSAATEVPDERWSAAEFYDPTGETAGKMSVRWAALIEGHDQFDPQFFGITPREAARMDPQQRLLLEVAWEAMENAGRPADQLAGTRTGVFIGIGGTDYTKVAVPYDDYYQHIDAHMGTGNALSIASNRLSYIFDFHGPSASVDTACSSSSLAIHFAVESLRRGESDAAIAGGVNMILTPETTIAFSKARMLSPEGMCRPFDSRADGYVRGEGCGLLLLKRLSNAQRDGDQIIAVLRATSVNQDGRTSGISAPNSRSQIECIRAAMKQAALTPGDIDYIEAHGTGTPLGDPIEMQALTEIFTVAESLRDSNAAPSKSPPCYVSSVKANVGHMETVSGVAGLIKVALMMQHEEIAPQTHFQELNPHIDLANTRLAIPTEHLPWHSSNRPRIAGVSSFGFGGTNTHLILEAPESLPAQAPRAGASSPPAAHQFNRPLHLLKLSAKSEAALAHEAQQFADYLQHHPHAKLEDVCWSANTGRADFAYRAAVTAKDPQQLSERLRTLANGEAASAAGVKHNTVRTLGRPKVAFLFTGQGLQYPGMGRGLYETQPVFRSALEKCDAILRTHWNGESLLSVLYPTHLPLSPGEGRGEGESSKPSHPHPALSQGERDLIHQTRYTQPALFALEYALAELWKSWSVTPDIVLGHSVGEYAAACVAGIMTLEDGLKLIAERARLMQGVQRHGKMAVVFAPASKVTKSLAQSALPLPPGEGRGEGELPTHEAPSPCPLPRGEGSQCVVAVINGPENTVISGDADHVDRLVAQFEAEGVQAKPLTVSHAFHSPLMDEMLDEFEQVAASIPYHKPQVPLAANLTGQLLIEAPTARYWRDHLRNTVQFAAGMDRIAEAEPAMIIEIGPTASLLGMGRRCVPKLDTAWLPSLREGQDDWQVITASVSEYYVRGGHIDWRGWDSPWQRHRLLLPTYPFERARHWYNLDPARRRYFAADGEAASASSASGPSIHPLLGSKLSTVWANTLFEARLSARAPAYLADHVVQGSAVTPAAAYVEQALAAAEQVFGPGRHGITNLVIQQAMFLPEGTRRRIEVSVAPETGGEATFETYGRPADEENASAWTMHATGSLTHESRSSADAGQKISLDDVRSRAVSITSKEDFYELMSERGLNYGLTFQVLNDLHRGTADALARIELPESVVQQSSAYHIHPALGDALLQSMAGAVPLEDDGSFSPFTYMPVGIRRVRVAADLDLSQPLFSYAVRTSSDSTASPERVEGNVFLVDGDGNVLAAFEGVEVQRLGRSGSADSDIDTSRWLYQVDWQEAPLQVARHGDLKPAPTANGAWLIFADEHGVGQRLADKFTERGEASVLVKHGEHLDSSAIDSTNGHPSKHLITAIDPLDESNYRDLIDATFITKQRGCLGVIHLWSLDIPEEPSPDPSLQGRGDFGRSLGCGSALQLLKSLTRSSLERAPAVWLVTGGAQAVEAAATKSPISVAQSPLVGFARVAAMELPDLRPRLVDLDPASTARPGDAANALAWEIAADDAEREIAYRGGKRFVSRLVRKPELAADAVTNESSTLTIPSGPCQLRITQAGSFDALRFVSVEREPPAVGQVEIEVHATGLNFSDVLKALGLYPGIKDAIVPLGIEASGIVTAVGPGVDRFKIGDEVFGVVPYAFASHARTAEYALVHKPASIAHDEACTIPITFLTAYYGLVRLAQLQPGERVLIHAGAGGVGLAAIQIARHFGTEVFATAGSDAKRDFLRSLGVKHVYSSRSTAFAEEILADTNREGIDIVLNSLPGEAITKSLSILRAYGRFLEIGKTDIYQNRMIGLLPFQDNLSYFAIDLDRMLRQRSDYIRGLFAEVMQHFESGQYKALEFTRFEAEGTIDAFRYMSQRKNIGKVVVSMESSQRAGSSPTPAAQETCIIRPDGTSLITGGTGALGLRVADWLAEQSADTIALLSRRGATAEVEAALAPIRNRGANVVVLTGDVADAASLENAIKQLPQNAPPLRAIIHAAGVLADGALADMSLEQLDRPMSPKVQGTWNLHTLSLKHPVDCFVMFSSVASVLGSPGQANYAAGNAFLDALAPARRAQDLPAIAINWGPWAGSGMAAEAGRSDAVKSRGMALLEPRPTLELLGKLLHSDASQAVVMDAHWADLLRLLGSRRPPLLTSVAAEVDTADGASADSRVDHAFRAKLAEANEETRQSLVADYIRNELARIMGIEPDSLQADRPLSTFGLDSLLALELKNNLETRLDFTLPMAKLMEGPSIASLATETARLLVGAASRAAPDEEGPPRLGGPTGDSGEEWQPLLTLRSNGSRPPLILLPALGGDIRCYAELVELLGDDQPVHAFRPRGVDQALPPHLTMNEMIEDYAAALREVQPNGPYYLGGWSTGGIFAYALAEHLESADEDVALLAMFDTPLPSICDDVDVDDDAKFFCTLLNFASRFSGTDVRLSYEELSASTTEEKFQKALTIARNQGMLPMEASEEFIRRLVKVGEANVRVIQDYEPKPLATAPIHLFVPTIKGGLAEVSGTTERNEADNGWSPKIGQELELHEILGDHFTMMTGGGIVELSQKMTILTAPTTVGGKKG